MFTKQKHLNWFILLTAAGFLILATACNQNSNAVKISLKPEPSLGNGIYRIVGFDAGEGLFWSPLIWSPNGKYLAGLRSRFPLPDCPGPIFIPCFGEKPYSEIFILDLTKMERRTIARSDDFEKYAGPISWFPDGEHLAYMSGPYLDAERGILSIDLTGTDTYLFMQEAGDPVWSPDGSRIALLESQNFFGEWKSFLYVLELSTQEKNLVFESEDYGFFIDSVGWTPDSEKLVFAYGLARDFKTVYADIFLFDLESKRVSQLTNDNYEYLAVGYSPSANLILLKREDLQASNPDENTSIILRDMNNNCDVELPVPYVYSASWSPDGQKFVITADEEAYIVNLAEYFGTGFTETGSICP